MVGVLKRVHSWKLIWNPKSWRFGSDDFPFQTGDFQVPAVNFPGCIGIMKPLLPKNGIFSQKGEVPLGCWWIDTRCCSCRMMFKIQKTIGGNVCTPQICGSFEYMLFVEAMIVSLASGFCFFFFFYPVRNFNSILFVVSGWCRQCCLYKGLPPKWHHFQIGNILFMDKLLLELILKNADSRFEILIISWFKDQHVDDILLLIRTFW